MGPLLGALWARRGVLVAAALASACATAVGVRLFSGVMYEWMIHEFDPQFNYRATVELVERGPDEFRNWFDTTTWYPLGRVVGGTLYPGLIFTSAAVWWVLQRLALPVSVKTVCVLMGPSVAPLTTLVLGAFAKEVAGGDVGAGLATAWVFSTLPAYNARSHAGAYDNEAVAIFAMVLTFYLFFGAMRRGSLAWGLAAAVAYFYMVSTWGGYIFITNLLPLYMLVLWATGKLTDRASVIYCAFVALGTFLAVQVPFVGFQHIQGGDHLAFFGVFGLLILRQLAMFLRGVLPDPKHQRLALQTLAATVGAGGVLVVVMLVLTGHIAPWTGRFYALLDPEWAARNVPIITSVAEHQPARYANFYYDLHLSVPFILIGVGVCLSKATAGHLFALVYFFVPLYFTSKMVRVMLVLSPAAGLLAGLGLHALLKVCSRMAVGGRWPALASTLGLVPARAARASRSRPPSPEAALLGCAGLLLTFLLGTVYHDHGVMMGRHYAGNQVTFHTRGADGSLVVVDDYREAYKWLRENTPEDAKVLSWWDYGYQLSAFSNRTVIVDNNTWNNTHIATVGKVLASSEEDAAPLLRRLDVDYVMIMYSGAFPHVSADDLAKFYWISRITSGVFPEVDYREYTVMTSRGWPSLDVNPETGSPVLMKSLLYRLSYHGIKGKNAFDNLRKSRFQQVAPLRHLEEAFSSQNLLVRLYRVKPDPGVPPPAGRPPGPG